MWRTEKQTTRRPRLGLVLLVAFVAVPLAEIALLIRVGGWLGVAPTLALIVLTAALGTWMLRRQGFGVLRRAQDQLERGRVPVAEVFEGFCLVIAGALLLTPGFITDVVGALLLVPAVRAALYRQLGRHLETSVVGRPPPGPGDHGRTIDGVFEELDRDAEPPPPSPPNDSMPPPRGGWGGAP